MGLPFIPEPVEKMVERFQKAFEHEFDVDKIANGAPDRPGTHRENVFDYEDGIRLIISKDRSGERVFIHLSASSLKEMGGKEMLESMVKRFLVLNAAPFEGQGAASSTDGVIHILIPVGIGCDNDPADSWKKA